MAAFPAYAKFLRDEFGEVDASALIRTEMESGFPKQTKVSARAMVTRSCVVVVDSLADYNSFMVWFRTTINMGTDWFDWTDPVDNTVKLARIVSGSLGKREPANKALTAWKMPLTLETWSS